MTWQPLDRSPGFNVIQRTCHTPCERLNLAELYSFLKLFNVTSMALRRFMNQNLPKVNRIRPSSVWSSHKSNAFQPRLSVEYNCQITNGNVGMACSSGTSTSTVPAQALNTHMVVHGPSTAPAIIQDADVLILDQDGVLWRGSEQIPYAAEVWKGRVTPCLWSGWDGHGDSSRNVCSEGVADEGCCQVYTLPLIIGLHAKSAKKCC